MTVLLQCQPIADIRVGANDDIDITHLFFFIYIEEIYYQWGMQNYIHDKPSPRYVISFQYFVFYIIVDMQF